MFPQKLNFCYIYSTMMYEIWSVAKHICHLTDYSLKKIEAIQGFDIWIIAAATECQWTRKQKNSLKNNTVCTSCMVTSNTIIGFFRRDANTQFDFKNYWGTNSKICSQNCKFFSNSSHPLWKVFTLGHITKEWKSGRQGHCYWIY